jgi:phenylacetate-coenzyme A ligase PaaK-like adenylate-forming protein
MPEQWNHKIFGVNEDNFNALAIEVFRFQYENNPVYQEYINTLHIKPGTVDSVEKIPFLPIRFFNSHQVVSGKFEAETLFESSGTTGMVKSRHHIKDLSLYEESFIKGFESFYGSIKDWCIIGLLPSYLERTNSSLVYMTEKIIHISEHPQSGFYLNEHEKLFAVLSELEKQEQKTLLIGVTFALIDFAERFSLPLRHTLIMETGGMKGRREELIREEVHAVLKKSFSLDKIHSEYGMTELLSQAWSKGDGIFKAPPWMKILIRDEEDPFLVSGPQYQSMTPVPGVINIIDLSNIHSCSFIATDDVGKLYPDGSFEVLGRLTGSDLRGCSLLLG